MTEKQSNPLTLEALQAILEANNKQQAENTLRLIEAIRKPPEPTEEEKARKKQEEDLRRQQGEQELAIQAARRREQQMCTHMHPNGTAAVAHVANGDFLMCVKNQCKIKRFPHPTDEPEQGFIYDENLFWRLVQARQQTTF